MAISAELKLPQIENRHPGSGLPWHSIPIDELLEALESRPSGLSREKAARRLTATGPNEFRKTRAISPFAILLRQFRSLVIGVLFVAAVISVSLGEMVDGI